VFYVHETKTTHTGMIDRYYCYTLKGTIIKLLKEIKNYREKEKSLKKITNNKTIIKKK